MRKREARSAKREVEPWRTPRRIHPVPRVAVLACFLFFAACTATQPAPQPGDGPLVPDEGALQQALLSVVALVVEHGGTGDAFGAGVIYDEQGHILTAHHVIEDADRILLLISGGYTVRAQVVGVDPVADFALLKAEAMLPERMQPAKFASAEARPGEFIWSIGNPFGTSRYGGEPSVGHGVVSATNRTYLNSDTGRLYLDSLQHDAPTNPGNSGGGVFNTRGELLGINALITTTRETPGDSGVAFAIPAHLLKTKTEALLKGRDVSHGWFGAQDYKQATEIFPQGFGRLRAVFGPVAPSGPAQMAGVQPGDVIIKVNDVELFGIHEVLMLEDAMQPGQQVTLTINRAGREFEITLIAGRRPWPAD